MAQAALRNFIITTLAICLPMARAASLHAFNRDRVHAEYRNGDFEKVIKDLDGFQKSGRACSYVDSLFLEKYLAVVYAANPATRELGRYHMYRLLDLSPSAELLDMFVGEEVDNVFEKVRKEHALAMATANQPHLAAANPKRETVLVRKPPAPRMATATKAVDVPASLVAPHVLPKAQSESAVAMPAKSTLETQTAKSDSDSGESWNQAGTWIGGGTALAVVAFTLYFAGSPKESATKTYVVPAAPSH